MPRNHRNIDIEEKRGALVAIARRLVLAEGYDAMGMARVATEAGVAPNTLYWYFEDKDALLIAVLDSLVQAAYTEYTKIQAKPLNAQMSWLIAQFEGMSGLISAVHARVPASASVRAWHDQFHRTVEMTLATQLAERGLHEAEAALAARVAMFVIEGLLSHRSSEPPTRDAIVMFVTALLPHQESVSAHRRQLRASSTPRPPKGRGTRRRVPVSRS